MHSLTPAAADLTSVALTAHGSIRRFTYPSGRQSEGAGNKDAMANTCSTAATSATAAVAAAAAAADAAAAVSRGDRSLFIRTVSPSVSRSVSASVCRWQSTSFVSDRSC